MQEIRDLRQQLQEKDADFKKLREEMSCNTKKGQLRRSITIESDTVDMEKQLNSAQQEAELLQEKLQQLEQQNKQLVDENSNLRSNKSFSLRHDGQQLDSQLSTEGTVNMTPLTQLQTGRGTPQDKYSELQHENSRLVTELSYYRKSRPDIGK